MVVLSHYECWNTHKLITDTNEEYTWKNLYGYYLNVFGNMEVNSPCVFHVRSLFLQAIIFKLTFYHLPRRGEGKVKNN